MTRYGPLGYSARPCMKVAIAADIMSKPNSPRSTVPLIASSKLGCWGPVVQCNVGKRGWMAGIGGCPNVGGICIGCTMPGFPDKFMPFMNQPPGSLLSSNAVSTYGRADSRAAALYPGIAEQGAKLETANGRMRTFARRDSVRGDEWPLSSRINDWTRDSPTHVVARVPIPASRMPKRLCGNWPPYSCRAASRNPVRSRAGAPTATDETRALPHCGCKYRTLD